MRLRFGVIDKKVKILLIGVGGGWFWVYEGVLVVVKRGCALFWSGKLIICDIY